MTVPARLAIPRLVIAAPASGAGKTTVATGLMAAFAAAGRRVSGHKVGPDYIDPTYHALATGRPGRNLDAVLCGASLIAPLFAHGAAGADIAVIEGVMGLFDGVSAPLAGQDPDHASTAHVARLLGAPVVLVVDARGAGRSVAALVAGFAGWDRRVDVAGVILNRVGSDRHAQVLRDALASAGFAVLGVLRRDDAVATPSRHLGLVPAAERPAAAAAAVARLGATVAAGCDLDALAALAVSARRLDVAAWDPADAAGPVATTGRAPRVATAAGPAFTFSYTEHAELLRAAGADVVEVDPLRDERLPAGTDALVVGGGFPQVHASALSANAGLRADIAALAGRGAPVAAECAGLLYLADRLDGAPMCGVLPLEATMTDRLTLGYRRAVAATDSPLVPAGAAVAAHEFHRTRVRPAARSAAGTAAGPAWGVDGGVEGFVRGRVHASYLHLHWAGVPGAASRFVAAARDQVPAR